MSLEDDLQEIEGVGEKTAEKIMAKVEGHESDTLTESEVNNLIGLLERGSADVALSRLQDQK